MTETFEVGQKVKVLDTDGEVVYGPVRSTFGTYTGYVVSKGGVDVWHKASDITAIPKTPAFTAGDVVELTTRRGVRATVEYGPFDDRDVYVVKLVDEPADPDVVRTFTALASGMRAVEAPEPVKVGDRVRVTDDDGGGAHRFNGLIGTVKKLNGADHWLPYLVEFGDGKGYHGGLNGRWNCKSVERVTDETTYVHNGVTYDLSAKYRDKDGDDWTFTAGGRGPDDTPNGAMNGHAGGGYSYTLGYAARNYGPLTRVTD